MELVKKIDIHVHTVRRKSIPRPDGTDYATAEELRDLYDRMGIEKGRTGYAAAL